MQLDNMKDVKKTFEEFKSIFTNIYDVKQELENQLRIKEDEKEDLLHEFEFGDIKGFEYIRLGTRVTKHRKERRIIKNKLELIMTIKGFIDNHIVKGIVGEIDQVIENIETLEKNQKNRKYIPRVLKDLKCAKRKDDKQ